MTGLPTLRRAASRTLAPLAEHIARLMQTPGLDRAGIQLIAGLYMPLGRAWAAAIAAQGSREKFLAACPGARGAELDRVLAMIGRLHRGYEAAERDWQAAMFDPAAPLALRVELTRRRARRAQRLMLGRTLFLGVHLRHRFAPVRFEIAPPAQVFAFQAPRLADPAHAFAPSSASFTPSTRVIAGKVALSWLRWPAMVDGQPDTGWARVIEPLDAQGRVIDRPPTVIMLHGIMSEAEMLRFDPRLFGALTGRGVRVVLPEAPWHGRRRRPGTYGGEPIIARGPAGLADLFDLWVGEAAALIGWARESGSAAVGLAGASLGALTTQLLLARCGMWQADCRPDAALLIATSGDVVEVGIEGSLPRAVGVPRLLRASGWRGADFERLRPLLEPLGRPALDPAKIVLLLGEKDDLTHFRGGIALARDWGVPAENLFVRRQGHLTVAAGLILAPQPVARLVDLLGGA